MVDKIIMLLIAFDILLVALKLIQSWCEEESLTQSKV